MAGVRVKFGADTSEFDSASRRVKKQVRQTSSELRSGVTEFAKYGAAATAAGAAITSALVLRGIEAVTAQQRLSRSLNVTNQEMAGLTAAFANFRLENDDVADALGTLADRADDAMSGTKSMAEDFERIGIEISDLRGKRPDELFRLFAQGIANTEDPTKRVAAAVRIFGDDIGRKLLPLLQRGPEAIDAFTEEAERLGLVLTQVESRQVEQAAEAMNQLQLANQGFTQQLAVEFAPVIEEANRQLQGLIEQAGGVGNAVDGFADRAITSVAFVADAVEGVRRTFEVAGKTAALAGLGITRAMLEASDVIINKPIGAINDLIEAFNRIPGVDIEPVGLSDLGEGIREQLATADRAIEIARKDINDTLMAPLPGTRIKEAIEEARKQSEEAAKSIAETNENIRSGTPQIETGQDEEAEKRREELNKRIEMIRESHMTEIELIRSRNEDKLEALKEGFELELLTRQQYDELKAEQERMAQEQITKIEKEASEKRQKQIEEEAKAKRDAFGSALGDMTVLMNTESRKMFEIGKAAALAQSTLNAYEAITGAYKVGANIGGPPLGAAFAAAAGAAQFATIASIQSQSFGGGGGARGGAGSTTQNINADRERVGDAGGGSLILNVQGSGSMVDIEQIAQGLGSYLEDGGTIGSVQLRRS